MSLLMLGHGPTKCALVWRGACRGVAHDISFVGFSTATIFGFHAFIEVTLIDAEILEKKATQATIAFVSLWGVFLTIFKKLTMLVW